ncbi:MAG: zf-HC2 domain-containing protein [Archangium sp.]
MDSECLSDANLAALADDGVVPEERRRLEAHLSGCANCRQKLARLRGAAAWLGASALPADPSFSARVSQQLSTAPRSTARWPLLVGALAASLLAGVFAWRTMRVDDEFTPRGGKAPLSALVGVESFANGTALHGGERLDGRALMFIVTNRSQRPLFLSLFAVDAKGEAHWFYPAFRTEADDPRSVAVPASPVTQPLNEAVAPEGVAPGPLRVVAMFTSSEVRVRDIEAALKTGGVDSLTERFHAEALHELALVGP